MVNGLLFRLMFRELKKNWFQYLSMLVITVLAVTLFLGFLSNSLTLNRRSELYLEEVNLADLVVQTTALEASDKTYLEEKAAAEYRIYSDGSFRKGDQSPETAEFFVSDGEINRPYITEGEAGFMIDARVADLSGFEIGDTVTAEFLSLKEAFAVVGLDAEFEFVITGFMHSIERVNIYSTSPVFVTREVFRSAVSGTAENLPQAYLDALTDRLYNQAVLQCGDPQTVKSEAEGYFSEKAQNNLIFIYDRDTMEAVVTVDEEVAQSLGMLYVFPVIFFFVALLVIMTTISRLILRERIHIGTMKALGISNGRIVFHYAFLSGIVTLIGCVIGAVLGPAIVPNVMGIKYTLMFSMPLLCGVVVSIPWTLLTLAVVFLCSSLIGVWASRSVIRENPAECMRPKQIGYRPHVKRGTGKQGALATHALLSCRMAVRNVRINWGRALMTVVGILGCSALLLTSFGIGDTLDASVANDLGGLFYYDVSFSYSQAQKEEIFDALDGWRETGEITSYEEVKSYVVTVQGKSETISVWVFSDRSETTSVTEKGNTLSKNKAQELGLAEGDEISFTVGSYVTTCTIDAVAETSVWNGFFTTENPFDESCYSSDLVWIRADDPAAAAELLGDLNGTLSVQTMEERKGEIESLISSTNTMKYTLMAFAVLLSVVVLYNLSLLNLKERLRDMATLKVLGYTHFQIALSLILEIMLLTVVGTLIGCACGYPLLRLVMTINEISIMSFVITLRSVSYIYAVCISLGTAIAINLVFGFLISGINMTESLKSVE